MLNPASRLSIDDRQEPRDEVFHRTRGILNDGRTVSLIVVNLSPHGMMARTGADLAAGTTIATNLPGAGTTDAAVRWSLGGRIGCRFGQPIDAGDYPAVLARMRA